MCTPCAACAAAALRPRRAAGAATRRLCTRPVSCVRSPRRSPRPRAVPPGKVRPMRRVHQHGHVRARQGLHQPVEGGPGDEDGVTGGPLRRCAQICPGGQQHRLHVRQYAGGLHRVMGVAAHQQPSPRLDEGQHHGEYARRRAPRHEYGRPRPRRLRQQPLGFGNARLRGVEVVRGGQLGHVQPCRHILQPPLVAGHVEARPPLRRAKHVIDGPHGRPLPHVKHMF